MNKKVYQPDATGHTQLPYREGVGIMLLNEYKEVFVAKRIDMRSEAWQMPQGGIDEGELPQQAAFRELLEETGTDKAKILKETERWLYYDLPEALIPKVWGGKYRGQKQKWYAMQFLGMDSDIDINTPSPEFSEWRWASAVSVPKLIVSFKQDLYKAVLKEFEDIIF